MPVEESVDMEVEEVPSRPLSPMQQLDIMKAIESAGSLKEHDPIRRDLEVKRHLA